MSRIGLGARRSSPRTAHPARVSGARLAICALALAPLVSAAVAAQDAGSLPPVAPPRAVTLPTPADRTLPNGLRVIVAERKGVPLAAVALLVKGGAETDPPGLEGLSELTAALLTRGTKTRSAPQIAEAIESLGGSIGSEADWDEMTATLGVLSPRLGQALPVLAEVVREPAFADDEIERLRKERLDELSLALRQPGTLARLAAARLVFGEAPYGHSASGLPASLSRITRADVVRHHGALFRPDNAILVIGGEVPPDVAFRLAEASFGSWAKPVAPLPTRKDAAGTSLPPRVVVIDKPDAGQAAVAAAGRGIKRSDPDYTTAIVAESVLSGYSGRLNQEIRIKRGLSYGARISLGARRDTGPFVAFAQTKNESAAEVASLFLQELSRLAKGELPETELVPRKAVLTGSFSRSLETGGGLAGALAALALHGLGFDEIGAFVPRVTAVEGNAVKQFAARTFSPADTSIVIVGDAKKFQADLNTSFPNAVVIPEAELDLSSATLKKK